MICARKKLFPLAVFWKIGKNSVFFQKEPHFCYKNQISPLVRLIICQNLRSFGQETTEISPFDSLFHSPLLRENWQKLRFFNNKLTFFIKYQISPLARPIICQNLRSFGSQTTEIGPHYLIYKDRNSKKYTTLKG